MNLNIRRLVFTSLLMALCTVATLVIKIPSPLYGYINMGDVIVLIAACLLARNDAFIAAAFGSALADLLGGYAAYAPMTFLIKGVMTLIVAKYKNDHLFISGIVAEVWMVLGYYLFEGLIYGFEAAIINIPFNLIQGSVCLLVAMALLKSFLSTKLFEEFKKQ